MDANEAADGVEGGNGAQIATSFFPPPPQVYTKYTEHNLALLAVLEQHQLAEGEEPWESLDAAQRMERQNTILREHLNDQDVSMQEDDDGAGVEREGEGQELLPDFDLLAELGKPNIDLIEEDGGYTVFGQTWPIPDVMPTLEQLGIPTLYPPGAAGKLGSTHSFSHLTHF